MYAAHFNVGVSKVGKTHFINFDLSVINDQYALNNESLFEEALQFIKEILFNPLFTEVVFDEEKRLLTEYFKGIYANKLKYAIKEMHKVMFKDETYLINALGSEETLENINLNNCIEGYKDMLKNDMITINVIGDIDFDEVEKSISDSLIFEERSFNPVLIDKSSKEIIKVNEIINKIDVKQAKLVMGYRLDAYYHTDNYLGAIIFNSLFGGSSESMLFKEIRDNLGLVYFISSSYDPYKGVLFILSGINKKDYETVLEAINTILNKIIEGDFPEELLEIVKKMQINGLIESLDSNVGVGSRINRDSLFKDKFNPKELITKLNQVSKEDVSRVAKSIKKDTIYLLRDDKDE